MNKNWIYGKLEDVVHKGSSNISRKKIEKEVGAYPVFGAKGLEKNISFYQQQEEYLAIIKDGAGIGRVSKHQAKSSVLATMQYLVPKEGIDIDFLKYFLNSIDFEKFRVGSTIPHIYFKDYKKIPFPLIEINEQKKIVALLEKSFVSIEEAKANLEQNLSNAQELFQSKLDAIFSQRGEGWEEKTLPEVAEYFGRGKSKHRPRNDIKLYGGEHPFVQTGDVRNASKYIRSYSQTYNEIGLSQSKLWNRGTTCITIPANIDQTAILDIDACFPDSVIGFVVDPKKADLEYAFYSLQYLKRDLQKLGKGSAQDNINLDTFNKTKFPFPSLETQKEIVKDLERLEEEVKKLEQLYLEKMNGIEELKKSLLQKAFSGELINKELELLK